MCSIQEIAQLFLLGIFAYLVKVGRYLSLAVLSRCEIVLNSWKCWNMPKKLYFTFRFDFVSLCDVSCLSTTQKRSFIRTSCIASQTGPPLQLDAWPRYGSVGVKCLNTQQRFAQLKNRPASRQSCSCQLALFSSEKDRLL